MMKSKMVSDRCRKTADLCAELEALADSVDAAEPTSNAAPFLRLLRRRVMAECVRLVDIDDACSAAAEEIAACRHRRDAVAADLHRRLSCFRDLVPAREWPLLAPTLPTGPRALLERAVALQRLLRRPGIELPVPPGSGFEIDLAEFRCSLEEPVAELRRILERLRDREHRYSLACAAKQESRRSFDRIYAPALRFVRCLVILLGQLKTTRRHRPPRRKRRRVVDVEESSEESDEGDD